MIRTKINIETCKCGHARDDHQHFSSTTQEGTGIVTFGSIWTTCWKCQPDGCGVDGEYDPSYKRCEKYVQDNLAYIEQLAAQRGLV